MASSTTASRLSPAAEAWRLIHQLIAAQRGRFLAVASEFELSPPQMMALEMLEPGRPAAMSELALSLGCDNSNVTGIVDRLEDRGLVARHTADHDRRLKLLHVTAAGAELRSRVLARLYDEGLASLAALSPDEQRMLLDLLRRALAPGSSQPDDAAPPERIRAGRVRIAESP
jgi:DNA-binding MarR family transcriptional regulator